MGDFRFVRFPKGESGENAGVGVGEGLEGTILLCYLIVNGKISVNTSNLSPQTKKRSGPVA